MIVALRVTKGSSSPSDFVIFLTLLGQVSSLPCYAILMLIIPPLQLYGPLNQLGFMYRSINQSLVDTEKLLKLLNEPTEINDREGATTLVVDDGEIEFGKRFTTSIRFES